MRKLLFSLALILVAASVAFAAVPGKINYQGVLKDPAGNAINNSALSIVFSIYSGATGGTALWTETQSVSVEAGLYNVQLGSVTPIPADGSVFDGSTRYLGIKVGTDSEMTPRLPLVSVPYAYVAQSAGVALTANTATTAESAVSAGNALTLAGRSPAISGTNIVPYTDGSGKLSASIVPAGVIVVSAESATSADNAKTINGIRASSEAIANYLYPLDAEKRLVLSGDLSMKGMVSLTNTNSGGIGIQALASGTPGENYGGFFQANGLTGKGVYGVALGSSAFGVYGSANSTDTGTNYGGYFTSAGANGIAVKGTATQTTGNSFGGVFDSQSSAGIGVRTTGAIAGISAESTGLGSKAIYAKCPTDSISCAIYGDASGGFGTGVIGTADATGVHGISTMGGNGGRFESISGGGIGVYSKGNKAGISTEASDYWARAVYGAATTLSDENNYGGYFTAAGGGAGSGAAGVYGKALHPTQTVYGGYFESTGSGGTGVYGYASSNTGVTTAGEFYCSSKDGYAGYFSGGRGVRVPAIASVDFSTAASTMEGTIYYNTNIKKLMVYTGTTGWQSIESF